MSSQEQNSCRLPTPPDEANPRPSPSTSSTTASSPPQAGSTSQAALYPTATYRDQVESDLLRGNRSEVEASSSLARLIEERWSNETPEVRERYRREEEEEAERRTARERGERG